MSNLSDKEIDRLSREAADSYEPDHSSLSWSRLEQKLTEQMPGRPPDGFRFGRINPYIWGPSIILISGLSFFIIKNIIHRPYSTRTTQTTTQPVSSKTDDKGTNESSIRSDSLLSSNKPVVSETEKGKGSPQPVSTPTKTKGKTVLSRDLRKSAYLTAGGRVKAEPGNRIYNPNPVPVYANGDISNDPGTIKNSDYKKRDSRNTLSSSAPATTAIIMSGSGSNGNLNGGGDYDKSVSEKSASEKSLQSYRPVISSGAALSKVKGNDSLLNRPSSSPIPHRSLHINRSLNFGFAFGPDYSNAGGIANNQISNNLGITLGYYLTSKLSVNSGIFYSNKFYWSPGKSYHPQVNPVPPVQTNTAYYTAPPPIDYVNGACNMYELPLTLRYDFFKSEKTKFFVNGGLSSYFMVKQTYIYFFHNGQRPQAWKTTNNQQVNYWFSVADFSFGAETDMGKGFSFQAEPFVRLPLKNMGVQNVKINSFGFLLSFRYSPVLSRSKK
jgi:hypothetical protein